MISLLVAMDQNQVIGYQNDLPWYLPNDLKFFKQKTTGNTIFMGRKTFEAIGKPLPNRTNVVITRKQTGFPEGIEVVHDIDAVLEWNRRHSDAEIFVIGGADIFRQLLPHADRMYITRIDETFKGDTYFPSFNEEDWQLTSRKRGEQNDKNPYTYYFLQYDRAR
ncbi:dihydrofolate reductase [Lentibacillus cibarius]|uniref:Dihydrofolate reductase n=1 Tax=Lentibacillus cibarius TaxID=2583219 RepID=A0A5S3QSN3_9BACI|nr:dihydrofolate reductase [Lentibacillus cibarius]TMN23696.1 dihydrofolate reductase [Lentibacillus cibarius]